jgi:hypothetical protein
MERWITMGATHRCGCGETYTDSDGGCEKTWDCSVCEDPIQCDGEHPDDRATLCRPCMESDIQGGAQ